MKLPRPDLQIEFGAALAGAKKTILRPALREIFKSVDVARVDTELQAFASKASLAILATHEMRGEVFFPTPALLRAKPSILGYYRLLYGFSQKQFYTAKTGCSHFKLMESKGLVSSKADAGLDQLCVAFGTVGSALIEGLEDHLAENLLPHELTLLTLGAQYRGGANNKRGAAGIRAVFEAVRNVVGDAIVSEGEAAIEIKNAAGRKVELLLAADPDILIKSFLTGNKTRPIIAIEVKAGEDVSNIHNRIGEAEKSHQKARLRQITECWTIINVDNVDHAILKTESPSTDRFYNLFNLVDRDSDEFHDFRERLRDLVGLS